MLRRTLTVLAAAALAVAVAPASAQGKKLRIGVEGAYPPFSEVGADGKLKGFEIDLANAYCAQMKVEC
jgi:arginine/ornithine transport system substrate-binding protein